MTSTITSRDNSLLKLARAVRDGKKKDLIFVEGLRLGEEALRSGLDIEAIIYSDEIADKERAAAFLQEASSVANRLAAVSEKLLATISYTKTPQGIVALAARPSSAADRLVPLSRKVPLLVVLHGINNPVNVGAILRSAEAAGSTGIIATGQTSDPFSPKSLRGAMGSAFRLPIWFGASYSDALAWCAKNGVQTVCADVLGAKTYTEIDWTGPRALVVGPEATGLSTEELKRAGEAVRIPMEGDVESLNVSVAAGIMLYEAARQRASR
jgi:TrmH family RNA methyltransferase